MSGYPQANGPSTKSERRLLSLVQNSSDVITVIDAGGTIRYDSPAVETVLGYKPEERVGTSVFAYVHPEDIHQATRIMEEILANPGKNVRVRFRLRHKGGTWPELEMTSTNLLKDAAICGIVLNWRDI